MFRGKQHPEERGAVAGEAFLTARGQQQRRVVHTEPRAERHGVALRAILRKGFGLLVGVQGARKPARRPIVFTRDEERSVLARLDEVR